MLRSLLRTLRYLVGHPVHRGRPWGAVLAHTVAVGAATDAEIIAIEPVPVTFAALQRNVALNGLTTRVSCLNIALGAQPGRVRMTASHDSMNAVIRADAAAEADAIEVVTDTLDHLLADRTPTMLKLDVEGYEAFVLVGAADTLRRPCLAAVILELNGSGSTYGVEDAAVHRLMCEAGFSSVAYSPITRELRDLAGQQSPLGNTVYVRDMREAQARLRSAPPFTIRGRSF